MSHNAGLPVNPPVTPEGPQGTGQLTLDVDGYPTEHALRVVESFKGSAGELLATVKTIWAYSGWGWSEEQAQDDLRGPVLRYSISTGGWSGNESLIQAMKRNFIFWHLHWVQHRRGGHYIFEVPSKDALAIQSLEGHQEPDPGAQGGQ